MLYRDVKRRAATAFVTGRWKYVLMLLLRGLEHGSALRGDLVLVLPQAGDDPSAARNYARTEALIVAETGLRLLLGYLLGEGRHKSDG
jgi:hypothetical protein